MISSPSDDTALKSTYQSWVADKFSCQPQEWLLEIVVGFRGDVIVLQVLFAVESNGLGLDLALLYVDFVAAEDDGDLLANTDQVTCRRPSDGISQLLKDRGLTMPVGHVLVGDSGGDVKHDDTALAVDVVSIAETTKLLLPSSIPDIELNSSVVL